MRVLRIDFTIGNINCNIHISINIEIKQPCSQPLLEFIYKAQKVVAKYQQNI